MRLWTQRPPLWLAAASVAAGWVAGFSLVGWVVLFLHNPIHKDFRIFYVAAQAGLEHGWASIYDLSTLRALSSAFPAGDNYIDSQTAFANPPLFAWIITPFTGLPLPAAYALWTLVSVALLIWAWSFIAPYAGLAKLALLLGALAMWPVADALYYGQPSLLILALVAATWWLCTHRRPLSAGVVLALATALKPQVVFVLPFAFLVAGQVRLFIAWAGGCAVLGLLFVAALGQVGIARWWSVLTYLQSDPHHAYFTLAYVFGTGLATYVAQGLLAVIAMTVARVKRHQLDVVVASGIVGSLAASVHLHQSDYAGLVLVAWLVLRSRPSVWQKVWLVASIPAMEAITLAQPLPQLLLDATWLIAMAISSFAGSDASALATPREGASGARVGT